MTCGVTDISLEQLFSWIKKRGNSF